MNLMGGEKQNKLTALADNYSYTIVPDWVYQCLQLNGNDAIIFALILSYQQKDGYYGGSFKYIEKRYGITEKTAKRILPKLEDRQYIIKQQGDSKTRNKYTINFDVVNSLIEKQQGQNDTRDNLTLGTKCPYPSDKMSLGVGTKCPPSNKYSNKDIYTDANDSVGLEKKEDDTSNTKKEADTKVPTSKKDNTPSKRKDGYTKTDYIADIKAYTKNEELQKALLDFYQMRKKIKKPIATARTTKMLLKKLNELDKDDNIKIDIVNQSVYHCWQDIYKLKNKEAAGNSQPQEVIPPAYKIWNGDEEYEPKPQLTEEEKAEREKETQEALKRLKSPSNIITRI